MHPTIVFDLDGTLVDTAPDLVETLNIIFASEGLPPVDYAGVRKLVGGGIKAMIVRGLEAEGRPCPPEKVERMFAKFVARYSDHIADLSRPFPGVADALDILSARGFTLAVCTNKLEALSVKLLDTLNMTQRFACICGQDTFKIQKPDPEILRRTIAAAGGDIMRTIMVGDSDTDIDTARAAGVPVVAVDFGYMVRPIAEFSPDRIISHYDELPGAIAEFLPSM